MTYLEVVHVRLFFLDHGGHVVDELEVEGILGGDFILRTELDTVIVVLRQLSCSEAGDSSDTSPGRASLSVKTRTVTCDTRLKVLSLLPLQVPNPSLLVVILGEKFWRLWFCEVD